jgi:hemin uptake protein HemP
MSDPDPPAHPLPARGRSAVPSARTTATSAPRTLRSEELFGEVPEVVILHGEDRYRLRVTSKDKLILTK